MQWGHNGTNSYNTPKKWWPQLCHRKVTWTSTEMPASVRKDSAQWSYELSAMNTAHNSQPEPWGTTRYVTQTTLCKDGLINANYTLLAHLPKSYMAKCAIIALPFSNQEKLCSCSHFTSSTTLNSIWNTDGNYPIVCCCFLLLLLVVCLFYYIKDNIIQHPLTSPTAALVIAIVAMTASILGIESEISRMRTIQEFLEQNLWLKSALVRLGRNTVLP